MGFELDLSKHGSELEKLYDQVLSSDPETTWAIFGYSGPNVLVPKTSGNGSLHEFIDEFDDSKIEYGLVRVEYNSVRKVVLIGFVGEGVPQSRKIDFNNHFTTVAKTFSAHHIQITARSPDDLTPAAILTKVDAAAGSKYSSNSHKTLATKPKYYAGDEGAPDEEWGDTKPIKVRDEPTLDKVSTSYKPTKVSLGKSKPEPENEDEPEKPNNAKQSIQGLNSSGSYTPVGKVDIAAIREAGKNSKFADTRLEKIESSYKPVGKVDIAAIRSQAKKQESFKNARESPKESNETKETKKEVNKEEPQQSDDDEPKFGSLSDRMKAFSKDADAAKPAFSKPRSNVPPKKSNFNSKSSSTSPWSSKNDSSSKPVSSHSGGFRDFGSSGGKTPAQLWAEKNAKRPKDVEEPSREINNHKNHVHEKDHDEDHDEQGQQESDPGEHIQSVSALKSRFAATKIEARDEPKEKSSSFAKDPEPVADVASRFVSQPKEPEPEPKHEPEPEPKHTLEPPAQPTSQEAGITVKVVDDYTADDTDELSIVTGTTIINVEKANEDWWFGEGPDGSTGLFPASYVEVIESKESNTATRSVPPPPAQPTQSTPQSAPAPQARSAVAQFDYEAGDDDELSFKENDLIINIEFPSEDWWQGELNGKVGLFPSSFVELQH